MKVTKEFVQLFPKTTWTDNEISDAMFTPFDAEDKRKNHIENKGILIIDLPIEEYAKKYNLIDLPDYLNKLKNNREKFPMTIYDGQCF